MGTSATVQGTIVRREGLSIVDTRALDWEPLGFERAFRKVLTRDPSGEPQAFIFYLPGQFASGYDLPHRHFHRTVHEFGFCLGGEFPHWEYETPESQHGLLVTRKPGYFMSRSPGSAHGREPGPFSRVGYTSLMWRSGTGNWIPEPNFRDETVVVDFADDWVQGDVVDAVPGPDGTVVRWADLTIFDTRAMAWEQCPDGLLRKRLWAEPGIELVHLAANAGPVELPHEHSLVLEGELSAAEARLPAGSFVDRAPGVALPLRAGAAGATLLHWRPA